MVLSHLAPCNPYCTGWQHMRDAPLCTLAVHIRTQHGVLHGQAPGYHSRLHVCCMQATGRLRRWHCCTCTNSRSPE